MTGDAFGAPAKALGSGVSAVGGLDLGDLGIENEFEAGYLQPGQDAYDLQGARGQQASVLDPLRGWALSGEGPSAAQNMLNRERSRQISDAMSMAGSMPGATPGARQRMAAEGAATATTGLAQAGAEVRAKEQQGAMALYTQMLNAYRQGDIDTYKAAAQAYADATRANAQVAAENAAARRGIVGGLIEGGAGIIGSIF
jgi:hypothetical protein